MDGIINFLGTFSSSNESWWLEILNYLKQKEAKINNALIEYNANRQLSHDINNKIHFFLYFSRTQQ